MNYLGIQIENSNLILLATKLSKNELETKLNQHLNYLWKNRLEKLENNYFLEHPENFHGAEKDRPTRKRLIFNEWFKIDNLELGLSQFYNLEKNLPLYWTVVELSVLALPSSNRD